eukprot:gene16825-21269_t
MAVTDEMVALALELKPHAACLVPERRQERTTEGGLEVAGQMDAIGAAVAKFNAAGIRASLFIATDPVQIAAAAAIKAPVIEFHTGALCDAFRDREDVVFMHELKRLQAAVHQAHELGIEVHAGHGIDYDTVPFIARIAHVRELNIGHFLIGGDPSDAPPDRFARQGTDRLIIGIGTDLCDGQRIEASMTRFKERFLDRIFTEAEQAHAFATARP